MPHGKGSQQSTRKNPREEKEEDFELEIDPTAREETLSPLYSASTAGTASSGSSVSSSQLEMILAANSKILADSIASNQRSMEASQKSMESSFLSALSTLSTSGSVAPSVALAPPPAVAPSPSVKVPKWTEGDQPFPFFTKLETAFTHNGVDKATWGRLLPVYLSGRAEIAFTQVDSSLLGDYDAVKSVLLKALGDTPAHAERHWWSLARLPGETPADFFSRVRHTGLRRLSQLPTREAVVDHVILSRFLSLLPVDSYAAVMSQHPKTGLEAAEFLLDFEETRAYSRKRQPWKDHHHHPRREHHRSHSPNNSSSGNSSGGNSSGNSSSGSGTKEASGGNPSAGAPTSGGSKNSGGKSDRGNRKQVICHNCGEPGHIRPNCPNRVRSVRSPEGDSVIAVTGLLAGVPVKGLQIDTGAGRTVIDSKHIPRSAYLGKSITLDTWKGRQYSEHKLAKLSIVIDGVSTVAVVAVAEDFGCPALLGLDLGPAMSAKITGIVADRTKAALSISEIEVPMHNEMVEQVKVTRAQAKQAAAEERDNDIVSAQSESEPIALSDVLDLPDAYFEPDEVFDASVDPLPDSSEWPEIDNVELPLPDIGCNSLKLGEEQKADSTLSDLWKKAEKAEKGYTFEHGVLVHHTSDGVDDFVVRVVVPMGKRQQVLQMGHSSSTAGHFGVKKTHAKIARHFVWPGLYTQVKAYVRTCKGCQLAAKQHKSRAPLQPLPCVGEPFQKVAFDLVGPLPRTSSGHKYLLTTMCLYTKYPDAIPLKKVDNTSVLDAMMQIFSRYGMPSEWLTDQGSVFTSKLTALMCKTFNITKIRTSPYHPQSDGALERWHACLKGMIKRSGGKLSEWDRQLKYLLFAYRDTPHVVTGFSPFSLMYGRDVRGPLLF